jgi:hypothetical protein
MAPKKCIPGVICIENMTLFVLTLVIISVGYLYYVVFVKVPRPDSSSRPLPPIVISQNSPPPTSLDNIYVPPLKTIDVRGPPLGVGIPVNIQTNSANTSYQQIGILTKNVRDGKDPLILPLMGRNLLNGRDKWQYYTAANSGGMSFQTKLPVSVNGHSCTGEYGCDSISNGDTVYVEGYEDTFRATIYENATLRYIPY